MKTSVDEKRTEEGELEGNILKTPHQSRPNFEIDGKDIHLIPANLESKITGFARKVDIIDLE